MDYSDSEGRLRMELVDVGDGGSTLSSAWLSTWALGKSEPVVWDRILSSSTVANYYCCLFLLD